MPDLINYTVTRLANATLSVPQWKIDGQIVNSKDHTIVIQDLTAAGVLFPNLLSNLTTAKQDEWVQEVVLNLIFRRFGLA